jgi:hypothetical protein
MDLKNLRAHQRIKEALHFNDNVMDAFAYTIIMHYTNTRI